MSDNYDYGLWLMVIINIAIFSTFVIGFLRPKKKYEWRTLGIFAAFVVALFTEMYGFPLTIYLLITIFGKQIDSVNPFGHLNGHLLGTLLGANISVKLLICVLGGIVTGLGILIMSKGWKQIHDSQGKLVTDGIYSYVRHPQYSGLFLVTIGMLIQWPTLLTLMMWPILTFAYYRLALREESEAIENYGPEYLRYKEKVPAFIPEFNKKYVGI